MENISDCVQSWSSSNDTSVGPPFSAFAMPLKSLKRGVRAAHGRVASPKPTSNINIWFEELKENQWWLSLCLAYCSILAIFLVHADRRWAPLLCLVTVTLLLLQRQKIVMVTLLPLQRHKNCAANFLALLNLLKV